MKKLAFVLAIAILMASMMSVTAFAHGGHGHHSGRGNRTSATPRANATPRYAACTVEGCATVGLHEHDGSWYCDQSGRTGNYAACTVEGCAELGLHEHGGTYYYCANHNTAGHGCGRARTR